MADWAGLHEDILYVILKKSKLIEDAPRFGATCKQWQNCFSINKNRLLPNPCPWLILPSDTFLYPFVSLSDNKLYKHRFTKHKSWGTPYGWSVHLGSGGIYLRNPVSKSRTPLPPLQMDASQIRKAVLLKHVSSSNTQGDHGFKFVVWLLFRGRSELVYAKPGDNTWRTTSIRFRNCEDVIYLKEKIFVIHKHGVYILRDIWSPIPQILGFVRIPPRDSFLRMYLVTLHEELHIVVKYDKILSNCFRKVGFAVFKLSLSTGLVEKVTTLGNHAIFVGNNTSFSLVVSNDSKIKPSCIYITDDSDNGLNFKLGSRLFGIFNLKTNHFEHFCTTGGGSLDDIFLVCQEYWMVPMFANEQNDVNCGV